LPEDDADFSTRWSRIKLNFTRQYLACGGRERPVSASRRHNRRRGVWQRRFWEHLIRGQDDFNRHLNYIHHNPVKHKLASCPHDWPHSSFEHWVQRGVYAPEWCCACEGRMPQRMDWQGVEVTAME
jgi:putative transposase